MAKKRFVDPFELLVRKQDILKLLTFFERLEERLAAAFPRSSRLISESTEPTAKLTRGSARRHYLNEAIVTAARDIGLPVEIKWTQPKTWSYPVVKIGGFSISLGVLNPTRRGFGKSLRTRSKYVAQLCARNPIIKPQDDLFDFSDKDVIVPDGSLGALIVSQFNPATPDVPSFLGFLVPSENLKGQYYLRSFEQMISELRERLKLGRRKSRRIIERKPLRRKPKKSGES